MKVFKDLISGDEMFSDSYPHQQLYNDAIWEVKAKYTKKSSDFVAIASDDVADYYDDGDMVVNLVDAFPLQEVQLTKKDFMSYVKGFFKSVVTKLKEEGKEDRVKGFQQGATEAVKYIVSNFDEFQFYAGANYNVDCWSRSLLPEGADRQGPHLPFLRRLP